MEIVGRETLPLAVLLEDMSVYPRHNLDDMNVRSLIDALEAGATLPPIIVDSVSKRVVDGWHRVRAYRKFLGATASIDVELRKYDSEADLLADAIRLNAIHGRRLERVDQIRCVQMLKEVGATEATIALTLNIPQERVSKLEVRVAIAPKSGTGAITGTTSVALKRPVLHLAGMQLTEEQAHAHLSAPGTSYVLVARQLRDALEANLINRSDERLEGELRELQNSLKKWFSAKSK